MASGRDARRSLVIAHRFSLRSLTTSVLLAEVLFAVEAQIVLPIKFPYIPYPKWFYNGTYASPSCETTFRCDTSSRNGTVPSCSCHQNCSLYDACCEDVRPSDWRRRALPPDAYECAVYPSLSTDWQGLISTVAGPSFVFLITKCPSEYTGSCLARLCDSPTGGASDDKLHFTWVSDRLTGVTYKNKFCALCHGLAEEKMIFWNKSYGCIDEPPWIRFGLTGCQHNVLFMDAIEGQLPRCSGPYYSRCSNASSQRMQEACTDSPARFIYDVENFETYRNYNCSLCNSRNTRWQCTPPTISLAIPVTINATLVSGFSGCIRERMACDAKEEPRFIKEFCIATDIRLKEATTSALTALLAAQHNRTFYAELGIRSGSNPLLPVALPMYVLSMLTLVPAQID